MPPVDQDFANASPEEKAAYLSSVDPDFKNASPEEQQAYIQHLSQAQGTQAPETAAPPPADTRSFLDKAAAQPSQFSHANPLRYFDELGQGMAQGVQGMLHPLDSAKKIGDTLRRGTIFDSQADEHAAEDRAAQNKPFLTQLGDMADQTAQGWGQAATIAPIAKGAGRVISEFAPKADVPTTKPVLSEPWRGERTGIPYQPNPRFTPPPPTPEALPPRTGPLLLKGEVEPPLGSIQNPGIHSKIPLRVPRSVLEAERAANQPQAELGSPENPGPHAKLPMRVPRSTLDHEAEADAATRGAEANRDATMDRRNIPPYAGEGIEGEEVSPRAVAPRIGGRRMGPPLRPLVGSPEEWQSYDNQKSILRPEASDAGLYSAARGSTRNLPDYQIRIGRTLNPYGGEPTAPVDLQDTDLIPRKKTSGQ